MEETLLADRAELQAMQGRLGEAHPEMAAKREKIRLTEAFLQDYQKRSAESVAQLQNSQLGPMLVQMVQQKLTETMRQEASLQAQFETSRAEAVDAQRPARRRSRSSNTTSSGFATSATCSVKQISSIDLQQDGQDVRAAVIDQPVPIDRPVSPRRAHVVLLVLFGGLGAGLMAVYVLDILDDRFRSVEDLQRQLGVSVLSMIRQLKVIRDGRTRLAAVARRAVRRRERGIPNPANRAGSGRRASQPDRRHQFRAGRREDHRAGQFGRLLRPVRQEDAADRRRPATARADQSDADARTSKGFRAILRADSPIG